MKPLKPKYNYEVGKFFDTAFYIVTSFFEDVMVRRVFKKFSKPEDLEYDMRFYNDIKAQSPIVPVSLMPFCYCTENQISFLITYVSSNINFEKCTFKAVKEILSDVRRSRKCFVDVYFSGLTSDERSLLYDARDINVINSLVTKSEIAAEYKCSFLTFLYTYETQIPTLIQTFEHVYEFVDKLHKKNTDFIQTIIDKLEDPDVDAKKKLYKYFALKQEKKNVFMFSLLNPYGILYRNRPGHYPFRVGEKFLSTLAIDNNYKHVSIQSFASTLSNDTKTEIFNMFLGSDFLCADDIINELGCSEYMISAYLNDLLREKLVVHTDVNSGKLFYKINEPYLVKFSECSQKMTTKYNEQKRKESLKDYVRQGKQRENNQHEAEKELA